MAEVDFNVIVHLGNFRNISLPTQGIYYVECSLFYGSNDDTEGIKIAPVSMFSSASTTDSFVKSQLINTQICGIPREADLDFCQIIDEDKVLRSRQFVIRYLDEVYELNDGVHWRLTAQNVDITMNGLYPPLCPEILHLQFDLFCCKLITDDSVDLMYDVVQLIPQSRGFEKITSQSLEMHRATSGVHAYYPIRFDRRHFVELDVMVHVGVTAVRFRDIVSGEVASVSKFDVALALDPIAEVSENSHSLPQDSLSRTLFSDDVDYTQESFASSGAKLQMAQRLAAVLADDADGENPYNVDPTLSPGHEYTLAKFTLLDASSDEGDPYGGALPDDDTSVSAPVSRKSHTPPRKAFSPMKKVSDSTDSSSISTTGRRSSPSLSKHSVGGEDDSYRMDNDEGVLSGATRINAGCSVAEQMSPYPSPGITPSHGAVARANARSDDFPYSPSNTNTRPKDVALSPRSATHDKHCPTPAEGVTIDAISGPRDVDIRTAMMSTGDEDGPVYLYSPSGSQQGSSSRSPPPALSHAPAGLKGPSPAMLQSRFESVSPISISSRSEYLPSAGLTSNGRDRSHQLSDTSGGEDPYGCGLASPLSDGPSAKKTPAKVSAGSFSPREALQSPTVSPSFKAATTFVSTPLLHKKSLLTIALTPKNTRRIVSHVKGALSSIRRAYSGEDASDSHAVNLETSLHSYEGDTDASIVSQGGVTALLSCYMQTLVVNWKALYKGVGGVLSGIGVEVDKGSELADADAVEVRLQDDIHAILSRLDGDSNVDNVLASIVAVMEMANQHFLNKWMVLFATLKRNLATTIAMLRPKYLSSVKEFWKSQMLVHTVCLSDMHMETDDHDTNNNFHLDTLRSLVAEEHRSIQDVIEGRSDAESLVLARYMPVYDPQVHKDLPRLPIMVMQQYVDAYSYNDVALSPGDNDLPHSSSFVGLDNNVIIAPTPLLKDQGGYELSEQNSRSSLVPPEPSLVRTVSSKHWHRADDGVKVPHLIVLQHGYMANAGDMKLLHNTLTALLLDPSTQRDDVHILRPQCNDFSNSKIADANSREGIAYMGSKLSEEIFRYTQDRMPDLMWSTYSGVGVGKVSFICHSIGGLVARSCLEDPMMEPLLPLMYTFVSLATPHLGTLFQDSQVVSAGLWAFNKLKKCKILDELSLSDSPNDSEECRLCCLARNDVLTNFTNAVILVSSIKDFYVPYYSTRVDVSSRVKNDSKTGPVIVKMAADLLSQLDCTKLIRITIDNNVTEAEKVSALEAYTGRNAHISYLQNQVLVEQLLFVLHPFLL